MLGRLIAIAIALGCAAATFTIVTLGSHLLLTASIPAFLSFAAIVLACGPSSWMVTTAEALGSMRRAIMLAEWQPPRFIIYGLAACGIGLGGWNLYTAWQRPTNLEETDQGAYLETATQIQMEGGIPALIRNLYSGQFLEANRHPIYLGLLSISPTASWGKVLSIIAVVIAVTGTVAMLFRRHSHLASALFLIGCGLNPALLKTATMVCCEGWLLLWIAVTWWILDAPQTSSSNQVVVGSPSFGNSVLAGLALGLGWLTKGTALPLMPLTACWIVFQKQNGSRRISHAFMVMGLLIGGWIVSTHPLLVRNVRAFGSPFHNVNSWLLFVDAFEDPVALSQAQPLGSAAREYLRAHSVSDMVKREANGLVWESFVLVRLLGIGPSNLSRAATGTLIALFALLGISTTRRAAAPLVMLWTLTMIPLFAWYIPIAADDRFLVPFAPLWHAYAAEGAAGLLAAWFGPCRIEREHA